MRTIPCLLCAGSGRRRAPWGWVACLDCRGSGRVHHCVACGGRGKLWLGGTEYIDCPVCPSARGGVRPVRTYVVMGGRTFARVPLAVARG